jgi:hypothetical protein
MNGKDAFARVLGPRPELVLSIEDGFVVAVWVDGRRPDILIHDYDVRADEADARIDFDGLAYAPVRWRFAPWQLGLALAPLCFHSTQGTTPHVPA